MFRNTMGLIQSDKSVKKTQKEKETNKKHLDSKSKVNNSDFPFLFLPGFIEVFLSSV